LKEIEIKGEEKILLGDFEQTQKTIQTIAA